MRFIRSLISNWKGAYAFKSLPTAEKPIVFYSEGIPSSPHLGPLVQELVARGRSIKLLVSDKDDPLTEQVGTEDSYWVGSGSARAWTFSALEKSVLITTTPDLETMQLKRSKHDTFYVYAHHSMISTHMGYRPGAFDHFDAILCTGPHHVEETRTQESLNQLPPKILIEQGYCRLDTLRNANLNAAHADVKNVPQTLGKILIAPTWGDNSILSICGQEMIDILLRSGFHVVLRPHPETARISPQQIQKISERVADHEHFEFDSDPTSETWMQRSDLMISDWSGVAMEYSYAFEKPVLFIDLPRKINNPDYGKLEIEPLEVSVRNEIGQVLALEDLHQLPDVIGNLLSQDSEISNDIRISRENRVFNLGMSATIGADFIEQISDQRQ
jgi:hypothetical protein